MRLNPLSIHTVLGIETSCDETGVAVLQVERGKPKLLANLLYSQVTLHRKYGGVVPEVAARAHVEKLPVLLKLAENESGLRLRDLDSIAVASGPGLISSLAVGVETARTLAWALEKPLFGVNHLEGHVMANFFTRPQPKLPALCLIVSGGHTEIVLMKGFGRFVKLGRTQDDAAGEAFDKVAQILGLGYPGGPAIQKIAQGVSNITTVLPRPMLNRKNFDFSFAGLKTAVLYKTMGRRLTKAQRFELAAAFQEAVVDVLVQKTIRAAKTIRVKSVLIGGGVAANTFLRKRMRNAVQKELRGVTYHEPDLKLCTDNAAMIALAGYYRLTRGERSNWKTLRVDPTWEVQR